MPIHTETVKRTSLVSKNITVMSKRTSVRLEPDMWNALKEISSREQCTIHDICSLINLRKAENTSLTAAIRVFIMLYFKAAATEEGHLRAGHGSIENMRVRARVSKVHTNTNKRDWSNSGSAGNPLVEIYSANVR